MQCLDSTHVELGMQMDRPRTSNTYNQKGRRVSICFNYKKSWAEIETQPRGDKKGNP